MILNILIKSLSSTVHGPDFNLCLSLLREPSAILSDIDSEDETFLQTMPFLQQLHDLVRTCQFTKFWTLFNSSSDAARILRENPSYFPAHKGLEEKFRYEFASSIAASFRNVKVAQLQRWLNLKDAEVKQWAESHGWTINGDIAAIPGNGDNDVKAGVVKEKVELNRGLTYSRSSTDRQSSPSLFPLRRSRRSLAGASSRDALCISCILLECDGCSRQAKPRTLDQDGGTTAAEIKKLHGPRSTNNTGYIHPSFATLLRSARPQLNPSRRVAAHESIDVCWMSGRNSRDGSDGLVPKTDDALSTRGENVETALHVSDREVGRELRVLAPLRAQDRQPPPRLTVVRNRLCWFELRRWQGRVEHELLRIHIEDWRVSWNFTTHCHSSLG